MTVAAGSLARARTFRAVAAAASKAPPPKPSITVMTYNILAQKYADSGWHNYCPPQYLGWEYRKQRLLEELGQYGSDIICLQEVESTAFSRDLQPFLTKQGYRGHYLSRQYGENVQGPPEGVALFYRTEAFELLHLRSLIFSSVPTDPPAPLGRSLSSWDTDDHKVSLLAASSAGGRASAPGMTSSSPTQSQDWADTLGAASDVEPSGSELEPPALLDGGRTWDSVTAAAPERPAAAPPATAAAAAKRSGSGGSPGKQSSGGPAGAAAGGSSPSRSSSTSTSSSSGPWGRSAGGSGGRRGRNDFWDVFTKRQEGAILALLRHRASRRVLLAAVTHLFWNPAYPDVKAAQAAALCNEMAAFLRQHTGLAPDGVPVVLAGDFNSLSQKRVRDAFDRAIPEGSDGLVSGVVTLLTRGRLPPEYPDHPASRRRPGEAANPDFAGVELTTSGLRLASAYCLANGRDPPLTTRTATFAGCLDYIFMSPQHFHVARTLDLPYDVPNKDAVRSPLHDVDFPAIPNDEFPSDHLSLAALLEFKG